MTVLTPAWGVCKPNAISHDHRDSGCAGDKRCDGASGSESHRTSTGHSEARGSPLVGLTLHADILDGILFQSVVKDGLNLDSAIIFKK